MQSVELENELIFLWWEFLINTWISLPDTKASQNPPRLQRHKEIRQFFLETKPRWRSVIIKFMLIVATLKLSKDVLQLRGQFTKHLNDFLCFVMMRQTSKRLE